MSKWAWNFRDDQVVIYDEVGEPRLIVLPLRAQPVSTAAQDIVDLLNDESRKRIRELEEQIDDLKDEVRYLDMEIKFINQERGIDE